MPPKSGRRGGGCSNQPAHPPFVGLGKPRPPFMGVRRSRPPFVDVERSHPPFVVHGLAHFPCRRGGKGGPSLRRGFQGGKGCRPSFLWGRPGPCFDQGGCRKPFYHPCMGGKVFQGAWWGAPHRRQCRPRRRRLAFGRGTLAAATFELARALWTLSREDDSSDVEEEEEEEETPCRGGPENEAEADATARGRSSSGVHQEEGGTRQREPAEELADCCRSEDVWENCGQGSWMTEVEVWPYAENEVEAYMLEDGRVEVRCEHAHGETPIASNTQVLPCPPFGPATLTTAYGPPNALPGMLGLLVTPKESEETRKAPAPAGEEGTSAEGEELPTQEDAEIIDISDAMEKC